MEERAGKSKQINTKKMKLKIGKGDKIQVITGQDKGKQGSVLAVDTKKMLIKIQGIKMLTHYEKQDGLKQKEGFISYSNVKLVEKASKEKAAKKKTASKSK